VRAVVWHGRGDVRVEEVPEPPSPGRDDVTVAVEWCGICGTDLEEWRNGPRFVPVGEPHPVTGRKAPLVLGHEVSGRIAALGDGVSELQEGDLVALDALIYCGECWWCRRHQVTLCPQLAAIGLQADGGLAESVTVPARMCVPVPAGVTADTAALAEPIAVAVRALRRGRLALNESLVVLGAGMIGIASLVVGRSMGAAPIVVAEPIASRRELAQTLGADLTVDPREPDFIKMVRDVTARRGADVAVDAAGSPDSGPAAIAAARPGGRAVVVGLASQPAQIDLFAFASAEKELIGSLSHVWDEDFAAAVRLLADRILTAEQVVGRRLSLEETVDHGFTAIEDPDAAGVKVQVSPHLRIGDDSSWRTRTVDKAPFSEQGRPC
jgi:(R,R)-butanediol dehydrogenase / meso-butanediol dehydrogenase / diacetyl reductase